MLRIGEVFQLKNYLHSFNSPLRKMIWLETFFDGVLSYETGSRKHQFWRCSSKGTSGPAKDHCQEESIPSMSVGMLRQTSGWALYSSRGAACWDHNVNDSPELSIHRSWSLCIPEAGEYNHQEMDYLGSNLSSPPSWRIPDKIGVPAVWWHNVLICPMWIVIVG